MLGELLAIGTYRTSLGDKVVVFAKILSGLGGRNSDGTHNNAEVMIKSAILTLIIFGLVAHGGSYLIYKVSGDGYDWTTAENAEGQRKEQADGSREDQASKRKMARQRRRARQCVEPPMVWRQEQPPSTIDEF